MYYLVLGCLLVVSMGMFIVSCNKGNKVMENLCEIVFISNLVILFISVIVSASLNQDADFCYMLSEKEIPIESVWQNPNGDYFCIDSKKNKINMYNLKLSDKTKLLETKYKQRNKLLDMIVEDFTNKTLYLNIKDVKQLK